MLESPWSICSSQRNLKWKLLLLLYHLCCPFWWQHWLLNHSLSRTIIWLLLIWNTSSLIYIKKPILLLSSPAWRRHPMQNAPRTLVLPSTINFQWSFNMNVWMSSDIFLRDTTKDKSFTISLYLLDLAFIHGHYIKKVIELQLHLK